MPPQSRGKKSRAQALQSSSTPNLPTFASLSPLSPVPASPEHTPTNNIPNPLGSPAFNVPPEDSDHDDADFESQFYQNDDSEGSSDSDIAPLTNGDSRERRSSLPHSHSFLGANPFAPPFYNRPPTPLPPSPSLTSLLRPSFSTTTSRPTTPDSSDAETPNDTEAAVAKSARIATTVPRASPKIPTYEYYGFVLYLLSSLAFLIYLLWSYLPMPFLHQLGIYYYPNRWWSLAIPSFLVMLIVYIYVALASYNTGYLTLPMNSVENLVDDTSKIAVPEKCKGRRSGSKSSASDGKARSNPEGWEDGTDWATEWSEGTDAVMDIPIGGVCEILYAT
ncbi:MAG: hypothetical protein M1833_003363 [Piccolia ochrophora]|nr:MAG: hypothetical protein M1833_003363 [Piccolia ochrophora]